MARHGSPPRAWGGLDLLNRRDQRFRLTPTCVGRTVAWAMPARAATAHPHVRGEDVTPAVQRALVSGSPPRAWGGHHQGRPGGPDRRLTPTCVGRTSMLMPSRTPERLTPTCVGRTWSRCRGRSWRPAHPHVRGEDLPYGDVIRREFGSPPRAWGGPTLARKLPSPCRLTPTCVGRTDDMIRGVRGGPAHPHVRGEDSPKREALMTFSGSPPRAWGGLHGGGVPGEQERLTPTCVGRTGEPGGQVASNPAHPHVRGEDTGPRRTRGRSPGSPPRAWGGRNARG